MPRFSFWTHPLVWCLLWMLLHVAARVAVSPALEMDEAECLHLTSAICGAGDAVSVASAAAA